MKSSVRNILPHVIFVIITLVIPASTAISQTETDIKDYIDKLNNGKVEEVKQVLPQLITQYQDTPDLIYLQGRLTTNGLEAAKYYQMVLDNFPKSEWSDDALYHLYQYHYATGLYQTAGKELDRLKNDYPSSKLLADADLISVPHDDIIATKPPVTEAIVAPKKEEDLRTVAKPAETKEDVAPPVLQKSHQSGKYALQVGAFSTAANADKQRIFFENLGYSVEVTSKVMTNKGLYLVWVGSYKSETDAKRDRDVIKKKYKINSMVVGR